MQWQGYFVLAQASFSSMDSKIDQPTTAENEMKMLILSEYLLNSLPAQQTDVCDLIHAPKKDFAEMQGVSLDS